MREVAADARLSGSELINPTCTECGSVLIGGTCTTDEVIEALALHAIAEHEFDFPINVGYGATPQASASVRIWVREGEIELAGRR